MAAKPDTREEYLALLTDEQRAVMTRLRETIRAALPEADDYFSYRMPAVAVGGKPVLWYAAWKKHYSLYPITESIAAAHAPEGTAYETEKGTIRFPASKPLPFDLVATLARARLAELREKGKF